MFTIEWIPTELDPTKTIAVPTRDALLSLLRARLAAAVPHQSASDGTVTVRVSEHPSLREVGGIVRVDDGRRGPLGIARIGRSSFVAYQLDSQGLREVPVEVDARAGSLRVRRPTR
jgi:hypothetical protein